MSGRLPAGMTAAEWFALPPETQRAIADRAGFFRNDYLDSLRTSERHARAEAAERFVDPYAGIRWDAIADPEAVGAVKEREDDPFAEADEPALAV